MPKKKQVTFQSHIPGKFIPREDPPPASSAFRSGTHDQRFNSKMAELLASSTVTNHQRESDSKSSTEGAVLASSSPETSGTDSSRVQSRLLHRRIVTMLETLRRRGGNGAATTSPPPSPRLASTHGESKSQPITFGQLRTANDQRAEESSRPTEEQSSVPRMKESEEPSLTVDEILATYYSKVQVPTASQVQSSSNPGFYMHSPSTPPLVLNEQSRHRPPPPSYSSSVSHVPRPVAPTRKIVFISSSSSSLIASRLAQPLVVLDQLYSPTAPPAVRPPPPRYEPGSAAAAVPSPIGFDREFSRLLYGREGGGGVKNRHQRQKRKAFSDPVK